MPPAEATRSLPLRHLDSYSSLITLQNPQILRSTIGVVVCSCVLILSDAGPIVAPRYLVLVTSLNPSRLIGLQIGDILLQVVLFDLRARDRLFVPPLLLILLGVEAMSAGARSSASGVLVRLQVLSLPVVSCLPASS
jgi:hypothetical protein